MGKNKEEQMEGKQDMIDDLPTMKASKIIEPKDLGVKIGSKRQATWEKVLAETSTLAEQSEVNLAIQRKIIEMAEQNIEIEKAKMKKS